MSLDVCFYFQVHQPWRLRRYRHADIGHHHDYFDERVNADILARVAHKCYLPMNALLRELIQTHWPHFRVSFSISATALQQMARFAPDVLSSFRALLATGGVELLSETSHHSLAALYSPREFAAQVQLHRQACQSLLGSPGFVFRNTELIVSNAVAAQVAALGCTGLCMEGADRLFDGPAVCTPHRFAAAPGLVALPRHYRLSDDIAFRFSDRHWNAWPLTAPRYAQWVRAQAEHLPAAAHGRGFLGLFMDYETFGEHQWADTGIFDFMCALPAALLGIDGLRFVTPSQVVPAVAANATLINVPEPLSWADLERDTSAWDGNPIQRDAMQAVFAMEPALRHHLRHHPGSASASLLEDWRRLLTSDHVYYMSTKHWADGDVHQYFSPFESPYDAYINYMNVLEDLRTRISGARVKPATKPGTRSGSTTPSRNA
ncbi:MAG TPA: glycoside hydrolase family 57 protein [Rhodanobacteraceae bacterium]